MPLTLSPWRLVVLSLLSVPLLAGCASKGPAPEAVAQVSEELGLGNPEQQAKVRAAFAEAEALQAEHANWFDRDEAVPLYIVGPVVTGPQQQRSKAHRTLSVW